MNLTMYIRCERVILSCKTQGQLASAWNYSQLAYRQGLFTLNESAKLTTLVIKQTKKVRK